MDHIIYTAMSGAQQTLETQSVIANNLANASTAGFRAQLLAMRAVPVASDGAYDTRVSVAVATSNADMAMGPVDYTGRDLDIVIAEGGWLAVMSPDGDEAYTRRGDLQIDGEGYVTTGDGLPVMGDGGPLQVTPGGRVFIGDDGTISVIGAGEAADTASPSGKLKLVSAEPDQLARGDDGLFRTVADENGFSAPLAADEAVRVVTGSLEGSNVNAASTMVDMIANARMFEMQMHVLKNAEENDQRANSLLSVNN